MFEYLVVIYIVHDANIQLYFYIASDILKKLNRSLQTSFKNDYRIVVEQVLNKNFSAPGLAVRQKYLPCLEDATPLCKNSRNRD